MAKQGTYEERVTSGERSARGLEGGGEGKGDGIGWKNQRARVRARVYVSARESTQARSPKWNSMTELEREKGNSDRKGEGNEMEVRWWR